MYSENEMDLAILDVMLPDIDGFRICQKLEKIIISYYNALQLKLMMADKIMGLTIGADDYNKKSFGGLQSENFLKSRYVRYNNAAKPFFKKNPMNMM